MSQIARLLIYSGDDAAVEEQLGHSLNDGVKVLRRRHRTDRLDALCARCPHAKRCHVWGATKDSRGHCAYYLCGCRQFVALPDAGVITPENPRGDLVDLDDQAVELHVLSIRVLTLPEGFLRLLGEISSGLSTLEESAPDWEQKRSTIVDEHKEQP